MPLSALVLRTAVATLSVSWLSAGCGLVMGVVATGVAVCWSGPVQAQRVPVKTTISTLLAPSARPALPFDWRVRTLDGTDVRIDAYRGRPIFLNLWATWCAPCVAELSSIATLRDSLAARGQRDVVFLLIAPETRGSVNRFRQRRPINLPFVVELDPLPPVLGIKAVPSTWLVGRDGRIAAVHRGALAWDAPDVVAFVARTLQ